MTIGELINKYGEDYSPYMSGLVNHLPMAQLALYKITGDLNKVESLSKTHIAKSRIDLVREEYPKCTSIKSCLGKRNMYESCLKILQDKIDEDNVTNYVEDILNTYPLGISSGLFHTLIRVYYAVEGFKLDRDLIEEVRRALAYYITGYREADIFKRDIDGQDIIEEMKKIINNPEIINLVHSQPTIGKTIRALYSSSYYMRSGFIIKGDKDEKAKALLGMLLPLFINTGNIVILHCITGLQALIGLQEYYADFNQTLDILTTSIITHILTVENLKFDLKPKDGVEFSWQYILSLASESTNVHNIKFAYSCNELYKIYPIRNLKRATLKRIDTI